jgi:heme exporter protein A
MEDADRRLQLEATSLHCCRGGRKVLRDLGFSLRGGEALAVRGANGSGKTTLLRVLAGLLRADEGTVSWCGHAIEAVRPEYLRALAYIGHSDGVKAGLTVWENLVLAQALRGGNGSPLSALRQLGLHELAEVPARRLSAGQRRRLALARLLIDEAPLWMLDEPFTALDAGGMETVTEMITLHVARGGLVVFSSHQSDRIPAARSLELDL